MAKSFWMADQKGNYSNDKNDTFDENKDYLGVRMQQGVPLLDRDWNELEDIRRYQDMMLRKNYICDGTPDNGFMISKVPDIEDFKISKGRYLVGGIEAVNRKDITYKGQTEVTVLETPGAERTDLVYIELTVEEVQGPKNEKDIDMQTCLRHKVHWTVKVRENSRELPEPEPFKWRASIALLKRNGGSLEIEDLRFINNGLDRDYRSLHVKEKLDANIVKTRSLNCNFDINTNRLTVNERALINRELDVVGVEEPANSGHYSVLTVIESGSDEVSKLVINKARGHEALEIHAKYHPSPGKLSDYSKVCDFSKVDSGLEFYSTETRTRVYGQLFVESKFAQSLKGYADSDMVREFEADREIASYSLVCMGKDGKITYSSKENSSRVIGVTTLTPRMLFLDTPKSQESSANTLSHEAALKILSNRAKKGLISADLLKKYKEGVADPNEIFPHLTDNNSALKNTFKHYVAFFGIAFCRFGKDNGEASPGDLLTSGNSGLAIVAPSDVKPGTIIGKALENAGDYVKMLIVHA